MFGMLSRTVKISLFLALVLSTKAQAYITPHQYYDPVRHLLVNMGQTHWDLSTGEDATKLQFVARSPTITENSIQSTLTMRVDQGEWTSAKKYAERWLRDFPKFGYELQMSREAQIGSLDGFDIEFKTKSSNRLARQFLVKRPHEMWVFTCSGDEQHFSEAWSACEKILKTVQVH